MALAKATPALVIRYSYLWRREQLLGREEGLKDRPCAVVMTVQDEDGRDIVTVLPVTHSPPQAPGNAVEIPADTKRRLGVDDVPYWVVLTEANRFVWPGPDLRPGVNREPSSITYGSLPERLFERIRLGFLLKIKGNQAPVVSRTEQTAALMIHKSVMLDCSPAAAFGAFTEAKEVTRWWGSDAVYRTVEWQADPRPDAASRA